MFSSLASLADNCRKMGAIKRLLLLGEIPQGYFRGKYRNDSSFRSRDLAKVPVALHEPPAQLTVTTCKSSIKHLMFFDASAAEFLQRGSESHS